MIESFKKDKLYLAPLAVFAILLVFVSSKLSPLYPTNDWSDINVYFSMGKAMMNGRSIYSEAFDHKGPLIFFLYGLGYLISNGSFFGMFLIEAIAWVFFVFAIFYTAKLILNDSLAFLVALLVALLSLNFSYFGGSAEEFILILSSWSLYLFYRYFIQANPSMHNRKWMLTHGILMSCVFYIKLNLVVLWIFPILGIFAILLLKKEYKNALENAIFGLIGIAIVSIPILAYFILNGALTEAYDIYIVLNSQYGSVVYELSYTLAICKGRLAFFMQKDYIGFFLCMAGLFYFPFKYIENNWGKLSMFLGGLSYLLMIIVPKTFHSYYPLSLYLFVSLGLISLIHPIRKQLNIKYSKKLIYGLALVGVILGLQSKSLFGYGGLQITRTYEPNTAAYHFAETIKKSRIKKPSLVNLGFGVGNNIFTICNIVPQQKYFLTPNIYHALYPQMRDEQTKYIENKSTDFILLDNYSFNYEYFSQLQALDTNYSLIDEYKQGSIDIKLYQAKP